MTERALLLSRPLLLFILPRYRYTKQDNVRCEGCNVSVSIGTSLPVRPSLICLTIITKLRSTCRAWCSIRIFGQIWFFLCTPSHYYSIRKRDFSCETRTSLTCHACAQSTTSSQRRCIFYGSKYGPACRGLLFLSFYINRGVLWEEVEIFGGKRLFFIFLYRGDVY